jgi:hypothetical protein
MGRIKSGFNCPMISEPPDSEPNQLPLDQLKSPIRKWSPER